MANACTCGFVINEALAFIQQKVEVMDDISLTQVCDMFSEQDIESARALLTSVLGQTPGPSTRRIGEGKKKRCIIDMIKCMRETDGKLLPKFVVLDISKLPPVTFDHVDVTTLLKEITTLKNDMRNLKLNALNDNFATCEDVTKIRKELHEFKTTYSLHLDCNNSDVNRGDPMTSVDNGPKLKATCSKLNQQMINKQTTPSTDKGANNFNSTESSENNNVWIKSHRGTSASDKTDPNNVLSKEKNYQKTSPINQTSKTANDWKEITYKKRKTSRILIKGKNESSGLKVLPKQRYIIASRFDPETTTDEINGLLISHNILCKIDKFMAKSGEFATFKIGFNIEKFEEIIKEEIWPPGIIVRNFIFKKPISTLNTENKTSRNGST